MVARLWFLAVCAQGFVQDPRERKKYSEKTAIPFSWREWSQSSKYRAHDGEALNIHVLPHSHDDPGWIRTSDQYYEQFVRHMYNTAVEALDANPMRKFQVVEQIYFHQWWNDNRTTDALRESCRKQVAAKLIEFAVGGWVMPDEAITDYPDIIDTMTAGHENIVELFGDDAAPRFGFQVDPFGASSAFAAFSAKMGFNGHLVARLNYYDKGWMQDNKQLEFVWRPDEAMFQSEGLEIFTHIMDQYGYTSPYLPLQDQLDYLCAPPLNRSDCPGGNFLWDGDDSQPASYWAEQAKEIGYNVYPLVNNSNVQFYADFLVNNSRQRQEWFATPNILWCHGTDFQYFNASAMYISMDQIIDHVSSNNGPGQRYEGVTIQYSMLSEYYAAVHESGRVDGQPWRVHAPSQGDFLPYSTINCAGASQDFSESCSGDAGPQYNVSWPQTWSGFYTSHASLKIDQRKHAAGLRSGQVLAALASSVPTTTHVAHRIRGEVTKLHHAVGLLTHHDAVSGTMGPGCGNGDGPECTIGIEMGSPNDVGGVDSDYQKRLDAQWQQTVPALEEATNALLSADSDFHIDSSDFEAALTAGHSATVAVQNSLGWQWTRWVRVLLPEEWPEDQGVSVTKDGEQVPSDITSAGAVACRDLSIAPTECLAADNPMDRDTNRKLLWFRADLPALGVSVFRVSPQERNARTYTTQPLVGKATVANSFFELTFDEVDGLVKIRDLSKGADVQLKQSLQEYSSFATVENRSSGDSWSLSYLGVRSGSYLFHPNATSPEPVSSSNGYPSLEILKGANGYVTEIRHSVSATESQAWRLFHDDDVFSAGFIQVQYGVGPVGGNKELVTHFKTDINTDADGAGSEFFSDNNGFSMLKRKFSASRSFPDGSASVVAPDDSYSTSLNYYPIVRSAYIGDGQRQLTLLVAQSGGVTSRSNGEIEVMLHRRSLQDDAKGACGIYNDTTGQPANLPEDPSAGTTCSGYQGSGTCRADGCPAFSIPMNISNRIEPEMWVLAGHVESSLQRMHELKQALNNPPALLYSGSSSSAGSYSPLGSQLGMPSKIHVLTLRPQLLTPRSSGRETESLVFRIQHLDASSTEATLVDLKASGFCNIFGDDAMVEERTLTMLFPLSGPEARPRWSWTTDANTSALAKRASMPCHASKLHMSPGDLRTFKVTPSAALFV